MSVGGGHRDENDWQITYEKVEPHPLCCAECRAALEENGRLREFREEQYHLLAEAYREVERLREALEEALSYWGSLMSAAAEDVYGEMPDEEEAAYSRLRGVAESPQEEKVDLPWAEHEPGSCDHCDELRAQEKK